MLTDWGASSDSALFYDPRATVSSREFMSPLRRDEQMELFAELHVWGSAKPGSRFELHGREIRVDQDGRFFQRFSVSDESALEIALRRQTPAVDEGPGIAEKQHRLNGE